MDGWHPAELTLVSYEVARWIAELFELIEDSAEWPHAAVHAKIAYLEKEGSRPGEAMSYRPITISSPIYRVWAAMRLRDMEHWINTWALPGMYAGIPGQGATDAWYTLLLELELKAPAASRIVEGPLTSKSSSTRYSETSFTGPPS